MPPDTGAPTVALDYDPFDAAVIADPYPWYRRLQDEAPVFHCRRHDIWVLSRYDDVRAAVRNHTGLSSAQGVAFQRIGPPMILTMDQPDHTRLRRFVSRDFTPAAVRRWRPMIERYVGAAIDRMLAARTADFVEELAGPLPVQVIAEVLGVPPSDYADFKRWSDGIVEGFRVGDSPEVDNAAILAIAEAGMGLNAYVEAGIAERRRAPRDDLFSRLLERRDGEALTDAELYWFFLLLLVAGNETTTNLLGNVAVALFDHPRQWELLRATRSVIPAAVEEALRFCGPIQGFFRTATRPIEVHGVEIPEGARVLVLFAAANRDPRQFDNPDVFDITRAPADHVAFGSGIHSCLGAALARLETTVVLEQLTTRMGRLELDGRVVRTANPMLRGVASLPVRAIES